jgi:hypothetical protein
MKTSYTFFLTICMLLSGLMAIQAQEKDFMISSELQKTPLYLGVPQVLYISPNLSKKQAKKIKYQIENGQILEQKDNKIILLSNQEGTATLSIKQKGEATVQKIFQVSPRPLVDVIFTFAETDKEPNSYSSHTDMDIEGDRKVNLDIGVPMDALLKAKVQVDGSFQLLHPEECNYAIKKMEASLFRGGRMIQSIKLDSSEFNLESMKEEKGDGISIKIIEVIRIDANTGEEIKEPLKNPYLSFFIL